MKKGDYILMVKKNRKVQCRELEEYFASCIANGYRPSDDSYARTYNAGHGGYETRECWVSDDVSGLPQTEKWRGVHGAAMLPRTAKDRNGKTTADTQYVFFSRDGITAEEVPNAERKHWEIENGLHWVLDIVFREDDSRARSGHSAENLNAVSRMVFNAPRPLEDNKQSF